MTIRERLDLPPAVPKPCNDCPWRRRAAAGWLGPLTAEQWIEAAHSEAPIACHETIRNVDESGSGSWDDPGIRQCKGAAIFRCNVHKSPRNPTDAEHATEADTVTVFASNAEFVEHHTRRNR